MSFCNVRFSVFASDPAYRFNDRLCLERAVRFCDGFMQNAKVDRQQDAFYRSSGLAFICVGVDLAAVRLLNYDGICHVLQLREDRRRDLAREGHHLRDAKFIVPFRYLQYRDLRDGVVLQRAVFASQALLRSRVDLEGFFVPGRFAVDIKYLVEVPYRGRAANDLKYGKCLAGFRAIYHVVSYCRFGNGAYRRVFRIGLECGTYANELY